MNSKDNIKEQQNRLKEICADNDVKYESLRSMLISAKTKKIKRNNYHQVTIAEIIQKNIK